MIYSDIAIHSHLGKISLSLRDGYKVTPDNKGKTSDYLVNPYVFVYKELFHRHIEKKYMQLPKPQKSFSKSMMLSTHERSCKIKLIVLELLITNYISFNTSCYSFRHINIFGGKGKTGKRHNISGNRTTLCSILTTIF